MRDSTTELCERAGLGDMAAASELVTRFYQRIFCYFRRQCGNDQDAEDLTQKTFAKVWTALPSYAGRYSFSTWIHGIGHNVYVDWRRKGNRLDSQSDEAWGHCETRGAG